MRSLILLLFVAGGAAAQEPAKPAAKPAAERPPLNLRLDNPSRFATIGDDEKGGKDLPTLGGDARRIETGTSRDTNSPFPKDGASPGGR